MFLDSSAQLHLVTFLCKVCEDIFVLFQAVWCLDSLVLATFSYIFCCLTNTRYIQCLDINLATLLHFVNFKK